MLLMSAPNDSPHGAARDAFPSTHWSVIVLARAQPSPAADAALAALCQTYWYPLYAYIRRQCGSADSAEDLTQEFFTRLLARDFLARLSPTGGKFRAYLLACCKHFLANQRDYDRARKRGGGQSVLALDWRGANERFAQEPADTLTPERLFERRWALAILDSILDRLRHEYQEDGGGELYEALKGALLGEAAAPYAAVANRLETTEAAVKKAVQRLRERYRSLLREQIAATVDSSEAVDEEIRDLFAALRP
jgi:RNA polymerase sigma-70 factor (ECF subfamily)